MIRGRKSPIVHVIAYKKNADSPVQLTVTPDPLDMTQYPRGSHTVTWQLDTKGFHFSRKSPPIEFTSPGWEKSFSDFRVSECRRFVTAQNRNRDGLAFAYNINVVEHATGTEVALDPVIQNQDK
jgi:hypothetical protein